MRGEADADTHFDLGLAYKEMGLFEEAIKAYGQALALDPSFYIAMLAKGRVSISYTNLSPETGALCVHEAKYPRYAELQQGCYWDFVRVVAAPNATGISSSLGDAGFPPEKTGSRTVLGGYLVVTAALVLSQHRGMGWESLKLAVMGSAEPSCSRYAMSPIT